MTILLGIFMTLKRKPSKDLFWLLLHVKCLCANGYWEHRRDGSLKVIFVNSSTRQPIKYLHFVTIVWASLEKKLFINFRSEKMFCNIFSILHCLLFTGGGN